MTRNLTLAVCGLIALGGEFAWAKTATCTMTSLERTVELRYENPGEAVPCEIAYSKPSEELGEQVLWRAENEAGYCEARFEEFVDKLRGFGWNCAGTDSDTPPTDDEADAEPEATEGDAPEAPTSE